MEDLPLDDKERPDVQLRYIAEEMLPLPLAGPYPLEPYFQVAFSQLLELKSRQNWEEFFMQVRNVKSVYLIDDCRIKNKEPAPYKDFMLKVYYWNICKHCKNCYVFEMV